MCEDYCAGLRGLVMPKIAFTIFMDLFRQFIRCIKRSIFYITTIIFLRAQLDRTNSSFVGWGMTALHYPPWHQGTRESVSRVFYETNAEFLAMVRVGGFDLTRLRVLNVDAKESVRGLSWRHYIMQWYVLWAARAIRNSGVVLV